MRRDRKRSDTYDKCLIMTGCVFAWIFATHNLPSCAALLLRIVVRPLCQISYLSRHRPVTIDILCSVGTVAFARFRCARLPLFGLSITLNLPSWKAVG